MHVAREKVNEAIGHTREHIEHVTRNLQGEFAETLDKRIAEITQEAFAAAGSDVPGLRQEMIHHINVNKREVTQQAAA